MKKRSLRWIAAVLAVLFCLSLAGFALAEEEPIGEDNPFIGKWIFTGIVEEDGTVNSDQLAGYEFLFNGVYYDFRTDGTCLLGMFGMEIPMSWKPGEEAGTALVARRLSGTEALLKIEDDHFTISAEDGLTNAELVFTREKTEPEEVPAVEVDPIVGKWAAVRIEDPEGNVVITGEDGNEGVKALLETITCDFAEDGSCSVFIFGLRAVSYWAHGEEENVVLIGADEEGGGLIVNMADGLIKLTDPSGEFPFVIVYGPAAAEEAAEEPAEEATEEPAEKAAEEPAEEAVEEAAEEAVEPAEATEPQEEAPAEENAGEEPAKADPESDPEQDSLTTPNATQRPWWW